MPPFLLRPPVYSGPKSIDYFLPEIHLTSFYKYKAYMHSEAENVQKIK